MAKLSKLVSFHPLQAIPPAGSTQAPYVRELYDRHVLEITDSISGYVYFEGIMPTTYTDGGFTVKIYFAVSESLSGTVTLKAGFKRLRYTPHPPDNIDHTSWASDKSASDTDVSGSVGDVHSIEISFADGSEIDNVDIGDLFRIRLARDITDSNTGTIQILHVEILENQ